MFQARVTRPARTDIGEILRWSEEQFGPEAMLRYEALIVAAIRDVAADPHRVGAKSRPDLSGGVYSWHLRLSRDRAKADPVHQPRHFLICRLAGDVVEIGSVLHDAMELTRHVDPETTWE